MVPFEYGGNVRNERREKGYLVECERSGAHLEIPHIFLLTDCECGTRNLSTKVFPLRRAKNDRAASKSSHIYSEIPMPITS